MSLEQARPLARFAGILYFVNLAGCMFAEAFVRGPLMVWRNPAATAVNIQTHTDLFRLGVAAEMLAVVAFLAAAVVFYDMFKPVSRRVAVFSLAVAAVEAAMHSLNMANQLMPLVLLSGAPSLGAFTPEQLQGMAYLSMNARLMGALIWSTFFGIYLLALAYLVWRSTFVPRVFAVLLVIGGIAVMVNGVGLMLLPELTRPFNMYLLMPFGLARLCLALWLVTRGINVRKWEAVAAAA